MWPYDKVLATYKRIGRRPRLRTADRVFWIWISKLWNNWRTPLIIVKPQTVIRWHRQGFRLYWRRKSTAKKIGRPNRSPRPMLRLEPYQLATSKPARVRCENCRDCRKPTPILPQWRKMEFPRSTGGIKIAVTEKFSLRPEFQILDTTPGKGYNCGNIGLTIGAAYHF